MRNDKSIPPSGYRCQGCGGPDFYVEHALGVTETLRIWLDDEHGQCIASRIEAVHVRRVRAANLTSDHTIEWEDADEAVENAEREVLELEVHNPALAEAASGADWRAETLSIVDDDESEEFSVCCARCQREIPFGWSQPNRGGQIWPVESADFDPRFIWPELRFADEWLRRGWLSA